MLRRLTGLHLFFSRPPNGFSCWHVLTAPCSREPGNISKARTASGGRRCDALGSGLYQCEPVFAHSLESRTTVMSPVSARDSGSFDAACFVLLSSCRRRRRLAQARLCPKRCRNPTPKRRVAFKASMPETQPDHAARTVKSVRNVVKTSGDDVLRMNSTKMLGINHAGRVLSTSYIVAFL